MTDELFTPAPDGAIWICIACGKTSKTKAGWTGPNAQRRASDPGWDESCMLNAILCKESSIQRNGAGRIIYADPC